MVDDAYGFALAQHIIMKPYNLLHSKCFFPFVFFPFRFAENDRVSRLVGGGSYVVASSSHDCKWDRGESNKKCPRSGCHDDDHVGCGGGRSWRESKKKTIIRTTTSTTTTRNLKQKRWRSSAMGLPATLYGERFSCCRSSERTRKEVPSRFSLSLDVDCFFLLPCAYMPTVLVRRLYDKKFCSSLSLLFSLLLFFAFNFIFSFIWWCIFFSRDIPFPFTRMLLSRQPATNLLLSSFQPKKNFWSFLNLEKKDGMVLLRYQTSCGDIKPFSQTFFCFSIKCNSNPAEFCKTKQ